MKFESTYDATTLVNTRATINVAREIVAADIVMSSLSRSTRGAIAKIAPSAIITKGLISSVPRTKPKSSP